jgi:hypothetical protein
MRGSGSELAPELAPLNQPEHSQLAALGRIGKSSGPPETFGEPHLLACSQSEPAPLETRQEVSADGRKRPALLVIGEGKLQLYQHDLDAEQ